MFSRWPSEFLSVRLSVRSPVVRLSVRTLFPVDNVCIDLIIYCHLLVSNLIAFKFCIRISTNNISLRTVNRQISRIYNRVIALVNVQKMVFASSSFTIWSITMGLHNNDCSNKSSILA